MSEPYGGKTVADLQQILKSRSLPYTGKKADLISRLQEADKAAEPTGMSHHIATPPRDLLGLDTIHAIRPNRLL